MADEKTFEERMAAAEDKFNSTSAAMLEARKQLVEKQDFIAKGFQLAGKEGLDFASPKVLAHFDASDSEGAVQKLRGHNDEAGRLQIQYDATAALHRIAKAELDELLGKESAGQRVELATPTLPGAAERKIRGLGDLIVSSKAYAEHKAQGGARKSIEETYGLTEFKADFLTSDGWPPESTRVPGLVIPYPTRPIRVLDIIPPGQTGQAVVKWMYESTLTHASAERAEAGAYAESEFDLTETSATVRSIGASIPVSDEQLEDVPMVRSYLQNRLTFGNMQRLDYQVLNGNGVAPNLGGILANGDLQTNANAGEPAPDTIYYGITDIAVNGRAVANAVVMNPLDWQDIRLLRTADGVYIWGSPSEAGPQRIWGLQVVITDAIAENTALVGDYANYCQLYERRGMEVMVGYVDDQFLNGMQTVRAGFRVAFAIYRGSAFCTATGI